MENNLLLTAEERAAITHERDAHVGSGVIYRGYVPHWAVRLCKAQLSKVLAALRAALKQSLAGEEIDLPADWYELFCSIQNSGITRQEDRRR